MQNHQLVIQSFDEFNDLEKKLSKNWERFHSNGQFPESVRAEIISSWQRCKQIGMNPSQGQPSLVLQGALFQEKREQNRFLLDAAMPNVEEYFQVHSDIAWFLSDPDGIILEIKANQENMKKVDKHHLLVGSDMSEKGIGTSATGIALIEKKPIQVFSSEHFCQSYHPYVDTAALIRDPFTRQVLGVLHMAADKHVVQGHNLMLLQQIINMIEQSINSTIMKENLLSIGAMFDIIQEPFILFDMNGINIRNNTAAKHILRVQVGDSLSNIIDIHYSTQEWKDILKNGIQGIFSGKDGSEWKIQFHPYKRGNQVFGVIALFQKKSVPLPSRPSVSKTTRYQFSDIVTQDPQMLRVIQLAKKAAFSDKTVLITGETGTGKEILAQSIHANGSRQKGPFIEVNCGAIPKELVASELFGYEGGAFTGAKSQGKKGKFLLADQGTIFLDEIGDLSLDIQVFLLRVLEERTVIPVGGSQSIPFHVRVIAATHKNLEDEVKKGNFREDLYHRLNIISLKVPSLRERKEDIPLLAQHFLNDSREAVGIQILDREVKDILCTYPWPGNIRQLKNVIDKMVFHADDGHIQLKDLPPEIQSANTSPFIKPKKKENTVRRSYRKKKIDKDTLIQVLEETKWSISNAAEILDVSRMTIYRKIKEYDL